MAIAARAESMRRSAAAAETLRAQAAWWQGRGITVKDIAAGGLSTVDEGLAAADRSQQISAAIFAPDEAQIRNPRHLKALLAACAVRGVQLVEGEPAEDFETAGRRVVAVRTSSGRFAAGQVCITTGSWSRPLAGRLNVAVSIKPVRGQIALLAPRVPVLRRIVNEERRYLVPRADGRVLVGSTEEDVGFVKRTTAEAIADLVRFAMELVPVLAEAELETSWAGLRPGTPDQRPYLGRVPDFDNAFVAAGHFRSGLQLSPGTAVVMRQAMLDQPTDIDLVAFRVDRDRQ